LYRGAFSGASAANNIGLTINQADTTNNPIGLSIINAGTGKGAFIDQNGNGIGVHIDSEATNQAGIYASVLAANTAGAIALVGGNVIPDFETVLAGTVTLNSHGTSMLDSAGGAITGTLGTPANTTPGQFKCIVYDWCTCTSTVSISLHETSDPEVATFDAVDEYGLFMWTGTEWVTISATCTFV